MLNTQNILIAKCFLRSEFYHSIIQNSKIKYFKIQIMLVLYSFIYSISQKLLNFNKKFKVNFFYFEV